MRYLITVVIAALSLNAVGQGIPQLPYNPDENGDGLIGVPDLQALLSQYGLEFNSAVLSEDAQSAIVYMGEMAHPVCNLACDNLPGFWHMSTMNDLALVWDEVTTSNEDVWVMNEDHITNSYAGADNLDIANFIYYSNTTLKVNAYPGQLKKCYCAAHELLKVEYTYCSGGAPAEEAFDQCITEKLQEGWYPLSGWPLARDIQGYSAGNIWTGYNPKTHAAFWRWAE